MSKLQHDTEMNYHTATVGEYTISVVPVSHDKSGYVWHGYADGIDGGLGQPYATPEAAYHAALTAALQWHAAQVHAIAEELRNLGN